MPMKIIRGPVRQPAKVVIYGVEGIGKTTLAAEFPSPLFLDTEDGSKHLDVARVACPEWGDLMLSMRELAVETHGFQTVVIDSVDWAAASCEKKVCKDAGKKSIEDWPYGKGYKILAEKFAELLEAAEAVVAAGLHVVMIAHAKVQRTSPPDLTEGYDRYELDLDKRLAPGVKEWADAVLFCNFKTRLIEGSDGRRKAIGGKDRLLYAERSAAYDAKNRFGLPEESPMTIDSLRPLFEGPAPRLTLRDRIAAAATADDLGRICAVVDDQAAKGKLTPEQVATLHGLIDTRRDELESAALEASA